MTKILFKLLVTFVISLLSYKVVTLAENKYDVTKVYKFKQQGWKVVEKQNIILKRPGIKPYQNLERVVELVKYKLKKGDAFKFCKVEYDSQLDKIFDSCDSDEKKLHITN
tara:strand:- start:786 stop:1115 length:330 start_codon:yes stop_codon:yes gene_type:complete